MKCHHCDKPALYQVNGVGYCKALRQAASKALVALGDKKTGRGYIVYLGAKK